MRFAPAWLALVVALLAPAVRAAPPGPLGAEKATVYVDDMRGDGPLAMDASALTTSLCTSLAKPKRFEIACAPDIKQIMGFAATAGLMGVDSQTSSKVEERLGKVGYVVTGALRKDGSGFALTLQASARGEESTGVVIVPGKVIHATEVKGDSPKAVLAKLDGAADKLLAAIGAATMAPPAAVQAKAAAPAPVVVPATAK